jgi:predicted dehydrogenase
MKKIRLGMIGGGHGSFIGAVHRKAAALDGHYELVCGAFSSDPEHSAQTGKELSLSPDRVYGTYTDMLKSEATLPADLRMQAVSIVTPNHLHTEPAILALQHGFHVIIDKPLAISLSQGQEIAAAMKQSGCLLALTHTYAGYPMLKEARHQVLGGRFGVIRKIYVEYTQGWLSTAVEQSGQKQASWRTDPKQAGAGAIGDIGTHAAHLAEYVSGLKITQLCASLETRVPGRRVDDDACALLRFENDASGILLATQVAAGEENRLTLRVYGENGGLEWTHEDPNTLLIKLTDQPVQLYRAGMACLSPAAAACTRLPSGHPEGFIEAFANIYVAFAHAVHRHHSGDHVTPIPDYPSITEGLRGLAFIEAMQASSNSTDKWTTLPL